jgi:hypothetical protein
MTEGVCLINNVRTSDDFGGDRGQPHTTMSEAPSDGKMHPCLKCRNCGHSVVIGPPPVATGTEYRVCQDIAARQQLGIAKYGTTVQDNPLTLLEWLRHAYQECLDQSVYIKRAIEEMEKNESYYKKLEEMFPVTPMNLHQVAIMNNALGHPKDENYRPYCMKNGCTKMPRMYRVEQGFKCWACHNVIGFDLRRIDSENASENTTNELRAVVCI